MDAGRAAPESDPGRLVRPFAIGVDGAPATSGLDLLTRVVARRPPGDDDHMRPERESLLRLAAQPQSVAELAALVGLPLSVAKLLIADMIESRDLALCTSASAVPGDDVLHMLLDGLRAL
ncbi:hypothetical protein LP52_19580 [Streptomonospora alba]|uniref:DUF742 domain-containing protein n=1 Tax=Streptomonospora alba TaxID=183763 RepID=A0A0C2J7M6_9ACTN|nr:DUF742 domain-containing protein [Streptomonospora alba]KIH97446.1 hypothetical protein LP52_19580 [Streptomonospora alba]